MRLQLFDFNILEINQATTTNLSFRDLIPSESVSFSRRMTLNQDNVLKCGLRVSKRCNITNKDRIGRFL